MSATQFSKLDKDVKRRIIQAGNSIRKKYLALKLERGEEDEALNKFLTPITNPLNELVENSTKRRVKKRKLKTEVLQQPSEETPSVKYKAPAVTREEQYGDFTDDGDDNVFEQPPVQSFKDDLETTIRENPVVFRNFIEQYPVMIRDHLIKYWTHSDDVDDGRDGLQYDNSNESWKMGDLPATFLANGDIQVGDVKYKGTPGLYDLIFLKNPVVFTKSDEEQFADILKRTNVYRKDNGQLKGNKSYKYTKIVKPLISAPPVRSVSTTASTEAARLRSKTKTSPGKYARTGPSTSKSVGKALVEYNEKPTQFVYYDDVNELVERFKKLEASKHVGNNNNLDEIMSILRELERLGVIEFYK